MTFRKTVLQNLIISDSNLTVPFYQLMAPLSNGIYFWRVKGGNANGWGPYSSTARFVVEAQAVNDNPETPANFSLYQNHPNPFNARTCIEYVLSASSSVSLEIYDIAGRRLQVLQSGYQEAGVHLVVWNADSWPSGIYLYKLKAGEASETRKCLLVK